MKLLKYFILFLLIPIVSYAADIPTSPHTNHGKKWRIAYYDGGPYFDFQKNFIATIDGLATLGWGTKVDFIKTTDESCQMLWEQTSDQFKSDFIEFPKDAYYSALWDDKMRMRCKLDLIKRLTIKKDIDLVIALGTWAGQDLANDIHNTPVVVGSTADAVKSGIIKSVEDSGFDHIVARMDPKRFERQLYLFYDLLKFKRLGIIYEDSEVGRTYASLAECEKISKEKGFELVRSTCLSDISTEQAEKGYIEALNKLVKMKIDAFYTTIHGGATIKNLPEVSKILIKNKIISFSQQEEPFLDSGIMLSISVDGYKYVGFYYASTIAKILNGAKPRSLPNLFEDPPKIVFNLKTAKAIGYNPRMILLNRVSKFIR